MRVESTSLRPFDASLIATVVEIDVLIVRKLRERKVTPLSRYYFAIPKIKRSPRASWRKCGHIPRSNRLAANLELPNCPFYSARRAVA